LILLGLSEMVNAGGQKSIFFCRKLWIIVLVSCSRPVEKPRLVDRAEDIVIVPQLLRHSKIAVTMRFTHTDLDSKRAAVAKLENHSNSLVTVRPEMGQMKAKLSQIHR
jgi:hypothetical protein